MKTAVGVVNSVSIIITKASGLLCVKIITKASGLYCDK